MLERETKEMSEARKLFEASSIESTAEIAKQLKPVQPEEETIVRIAYGQRILACCLLIVLPIAVVYLLLNISMFGWFTVEALAAIAFLLQAVIRLVFYRQRIHIRLNKEELVIDHLPIKWTEIAETGFMRSREGEIEKYALVVIKTDNNVTKRDLTPFIALDKKLSPLIEYYKAQSRLMPSPSSASS